MEWMAKAGWTLAAFVVMDFWRGIPWIVLQREAAAPTSRGRKVLLSLAITPIALAFIFAFERSYWGELWSWAFGDSGGILVGLAQVTAMWVLVSLAVFVVPLLTLPTTILDVAIGSLPAVGLALVGLVLDWVRSVAITPAARRLRAEQKQNLRRITRRRAPDRPGPPFCPYCGARVFASDRLLFFCMACGKELE